MTEKWFDKQVYLNTNYAGQQIVKAEFDDCTFKNCDFTNADLSETDFIGCRFELCNFANSILIYTGMKDVHFAECKLIGMNFDRCSDFLFSVTFGKCILDYSSFARKKMKRTSFVDCSLKEVDFAGTDLSGSVFRNCDLIRANFEHTNIENTDFRTAKNYNIDPEINRMKKAIFSFPGIAGLLVKYNIRIES